NSKQRVAFAKQLKPFLKKIKHSEREIIMSHICLQWNDVKLPKLMMNWDQVRELRDAGHYIGSHTVTHAMLGTMDNSEELRHELSESASRINKELGYFPRSISYPVGSYNEETIQLAKETGYVCGLAVHQDEYAPDKENLFAIKRIELYNEPWWKTKLRISNKLEAIKKVVRYR
ncbi:MAG: polysaccharide deacetylase family protein, partial [Crocinitomicaceae bacterium]|nr:polysaccharide deacetylase family protein [Crocinitomicaceae bacterium]